MVGQELRARFGTGTCAYCGEPFPRSGPRAAYCETHQDPANREDGFVVGAQPRKCQHCGAEFMASANAKWCDAHKKASSRKPLSARVEEMLDSEFACEARGFQEGGGSVGWYRKALVHFGRLNGEGLAIRVGSGWYRIDPRDLIDGLRKSGYKITWDNNDPPPLLDLDTYVTKPGKPQPPEHVPDGQKWCPRCGQCKPIETSWTPWWHGTRKRMYERKICKQCFNRHKNDQRTGNVVTCSVCKRKRARSRFSHAEYLKPRRRTCIDCQKKAGAKVFLTPEEFTRRRKDLVEEYLFAISGMGMTPEGALEFVAGSVGCAVEQLEEYKLRERAERVVLH